jgi:hypothetical protein
MRQKGKEGKKESLREGSTGPSPKVVIEKVTPGKIAGRVPTLRP